MTNEADTVKANTDRVIIPETLFITKEGAIGINCGGHVIVKTPAAWHALARLAHEAEGKAEAIESARTVVRQIAESMIGCSIDYAAEFIDNRLAAMAGEHAALSVSPSSIPDPGKSPSAAREHIKGTQVAQMIMDFWSDFSSAYPKDVMTSSLCAVGPLQAMIGLAIERGNLALPDPGVAAHDVLAERERQKSGEGWTAEHDDEYSHDELPRAAACYAAPEAAYWGPARDRSALRWPWSVSWWKPSDRRRNLVKAGALILAEIERLDRAASLKGGK